MIRYGPKAIFCVAFFFFTNIRNSETREAILEPKNIASIKFIGDKRTPIKKASLISPSPIHLPFDISQSKKKKSAKTNAPSKLYKR